MGGRGSSSSGGSAGGKAATGQTRTQGATQSPKFESSINRFGQHVSAAEKQKRYNQVMNELNQRYGPGTTYEVVQHDYRIVGKGKNKRTERYVAHRETVNRSDHAKWIAEHGY